MSVKNLPILVAAILLGTTTLASAQALVFSPYTYTYSYYAYAPIYAPAVTYGLAVAPQYYVPGYYAYAPVYDGWRRWDW